MRVGASVEAELLVEGRGKVLGVKEEGKVVFCFLFVMGLHVCAPTIYTQNPPRTLFSNPKPSVLNPNLQPSTLYLKGAQGKEKGRRQRVSVGGWEKREKPERVKSERTKNWGVCGLAEV